MTIRYIAASAMAPTVLLLVQEVCGHVPRGPGQQYYNKNVNSITTRPTNDI